MPGILGFIKKSGCRQTSDLLLESMSKPLRHLESYYEERIVGDFYGFESISLGGRQRLFERTSGGQEYVILIDGYVYSINGQAISNRNGRSENLVNSILEAVEDEQDSALSALEGNYTIAVYNRSREKLTLFNDIIGPRRLYYADFQDYFVFSSEVKAISALPGFYGQLNWKGIADFLNYGYILGDDTFFSDVWSLSSASIVNYDRRNDFIDIRKYWRPVYEQADMTFEEAVETTYALLRDSIQEKIEPASTVISPVSGGLDSRIILGILKDIESGLDIKACTHAQKFSNEYKYAKKVCQALGIKDHHFTEILPEYLIDKYKWAVWYTEGMVPLTNAHLLLLPDQIQRFDSMILTGIYGGPTNYAAEYFAERHLVNEYQGAEKVYDIQKIISLDRNAYNHIVSNHVLDTIQSSSFESINKEFCKHEEASKRFCNQRDAFFIENRMRRLICQTDLFRFFWEEHLPLSNHKLYHHYLRVPAEYKLGKKMLKQMLRDDFRQLALIKDANTDLNLFEAPSRTYKLKKTVSHQMRWYLNRISKGRIQLYDKSTYSHYGKWFQKNSAMYQLWREALMSGKMQELGLIEPKAVDNAMEFTRNTGLGFHALTRLATLSMWADLFLK